MPKTAKITSSCHTGVVAVMKDISTRGRGDQDAGRHQRRPRAEAADQPARQRREDQRANGHRQIDQAGVHRRVAALALQVQRHHEQERTPCGERAHRDHGRRGERDAAEEAQIDERVVAAGFVAQEADEGQRRSTSDRSAMTRVASSPWSAPSMSAKTMPNRVAHAEDLTDRVDVAHGRRLGLRHEDRGQHDGQRTDRQVDPEHRTPADVLDEQRRRRSGPAPSRCRRRRPRRRSRGRARPGR